MARCRARRALIRGQERGMRMSVAVIGLGYVGLPLALEATRSARAVIGFDLSEAVVGGLSQGLSHVDDITSGDVRGMLDAGFLPTSDPSALAQATTFVICVPTPLTEGGGPDLSAVRSACNTVSGVLKRGDLIVLESTSYPGTTEEFVAPILEQSGLRAGADFHLAFSPERIDPGNPHYGLRNTPKVVGGIDEASSAAACAFYEQVCDKVVPARGAREAEVANSLRTPTAT